MKDKKIDYTKEIISCVKFIVNQTRRNWTLKEAYYQAVSSYKWYIADEALYAIRRNI